LRFTFEEASFRVFEAPDSAVTCDMLRLPERPLVVLLPASLRSFLTTHSILVYKPFGVEALFAAVAHTGETIPTGSAARP
jgi:hypothetical protein